MRCSAAVYEGFRRSRSPSARPVAVSKFRYFIFELSFGTARKPCSMEPKLYNPITSKPALSSSTFAAISAWHGAIARRVLPTADSKAAHAFDSAARQSFGPWYVVQLKYVFLMTGDSWQLSPIQRWMIGFRAAPCVPITTGYFISTPTPYRFSLR